MKKQIYNPYLPSWEYIRTGSPVSLTAGYMYLGLMTGLTVMHSV